MLLAKRIQSASKDTRGTADTKPLMTESGEYHMSHMLNDVRVDNEFESSMKNLQNRKRTIVTIKKISPIRPANGGATSTSNRSLSYNLNPYP